MAILGEYQTKKMSKLGITWNGPEVITTGYSNRLAVQAVKVKTTRHIEGYRGLSRAFSVLPFPCFYILYVRRGFRNYT